MCLQDAGRSHYSGDGSVDWITALPVTAGLAEQEIPKFPEFCFGINNLAVHKLPFYINIDPNFDDQIFHINVIISLYRDDQ